MLLHGLVELEHNMDNDLSLEFLVERSMTINFKESERLFCFADKQQAIDFVTWIRNEGGWDLFNKWIKKKST